MAHIDYNFALGKPSEGGPVPPRAFRILLLGDFSGGADRPAGTARTFPADLDTLDALPGRLGAAVSLPWPDGDTRTTLTFNRLEDFQPDALVATVPLLAQLQALRGRLLDPATFPEAAAEVQSWAAVGPPPPIEPTTDAHRDAAGTGGLMDELLNKPVAPRPQPGAAGAVTPSIDAFIRNLVAPHVVPDPDPRRDDLVAAVESALSERLRSLLHSPAFQALESAWRGAQFLVQTLELDEDLSLHLLDLSRDQLERELAAAGDEPAAALHRLLVEEACGSPGGEPWTLVVGLYTFGREDTPLLERIGRLAAEARAVFLSGFDYGQATPTREASAEPWAALRGSPAAHRLVLALPRFLLRLPYGPETEPMDAFTFVENPLPPAPERYLWGHPALACGCLLAQAYRESGWALRPGEIAELGGLPLHAFKQDGESRMTPCAEHWLSDADAEALRGEGFTVLQSVRGRDAVRVECFQTVSGKDVPVGMG